MFQWIKSWWTDKEPTLDYSQPPATCTFREYRIVRGSVIVAPDLLSNAHVDHRYILQRRLVTYALDTKDIVRATKWANVYSNVERTPLETVMLTLKRAEQQAEEDHN